MKNFIFLVTLLVSLTTFGASKVLQGDTWKSSNLSKTWTPSATAGSLVTAQSVSGDMTAVVSGDLTNFQIKNSGVTASSDYTSVTVNAKGLVTAGVSYRAPTVQRFTSGSGTYTTPAGVKYIIVEMVGGGGGGAGGGSASSSSNGTAGSASTFGSSLLTANGGNGSNWSSNANTGGTVTVNSPAINILSINGASGMGTSFIASTSAQAQGSAGGLTPFAGGASGSAAGPSLAPIANTGAGGAGGGSGSNVSAYSGAGGAAGGYIKAIIPSPSASYSYSVGSAGNGGAAGTGGYAGTNGSQGLIIVTEFYQ